MASEVARTHHTHTTDRDADAGGHLIDDFASGTARARWGTTWRAFSDRLLGGGSDVELAFGEHQGRRCMLVQGRLRPRESPTFVQAALPLGRGGRGFDAREHAGFELVACGVPGTYFLHVREQGCSMPWQHYRAAFELEATGSASCCRSPRSSRSAPAAPSIAASSAGSASSPGRRCARRASPWPRWGSWPRGTIRAPEPLVQ